MKKIYAAVGPAVGLFFHILFPIVVFTLAFFLNSQSLIVSAVFLVTFLALPVLLNLIGTRQARGETVTPARAQRETKRERPGEEGPSKGQDSASNVGNARRGREAKISRAVKRTTPKRPSVSVIMPFHLPAPYLGDAVRSSLASESVEVTLWLINDGSTEDLPVAVKQMIDFDPRIRLISSTVNRGPYFARNLALQRVDTDYVAFLDSDDEQAPKRLITQIELLEESPGVVLTQCLGGRWEEDWARRISEVRTAYISLVFRKKLIEEIGYFDTVRYSGDAEFISRVKRSRGARAIALLDEELYFLRSLRNSLTRSPGQEVFRELPDGMLEHSPSQSRVSYEDHFRAWHRSAQFRVNPRLNFPQYARSFELGHESQEASPFMGENVIGSMASFPPRRAQLEQAVESVYPQVDELHVYLNGYDSVPAFLNKPRIRIYPQPFGNLMEVGKFFGPAEVDGYVLLLDDDIVYPDNYATRMLTAVELEGRSALVGVHGITYSRSRPSLIDDRFLCDFRQACSGGLVDALGTGTVAYHTDTIRFDIDDFKVRGFADLWMAQKCWARGIEMRSVARPKSWLRALETERSSRLYQANKQNRQESEAIFREVMSEILQRPAAQHED